MARFQQFDCTRCGAPLSLPNQEGQRVIRCDYCGTDGVYDGLDLDLSSSAPRTPSGKPVQLPGRRPLTFRYVTEVEQFEDLSVLSQIFIISVFFGSVIILILIFFWYFWKAVLPP